MVTSMVMHLLCVVYYHIYLVCRGEGGRWEGGRGGGREGERESE